MDHMIAVHAEAIARRLGETGTPVAAVTEFGRALGAGVETMTTLHAAHKEGLVLFNREMMR